MISCLGERNTCVLGEGMLIRANQNEGIRAKWVDGQPLQVGRIGDHANVTELIAHRIDYLVAGALFKLQRDARMLSQKGTDALGQVLA